MMFDMPARVGFYYEDIEFVEVKENGFRIKLMDDEHMFFVPELNVEKLQDSWILEYLLTLSSHPILKLWKPVVRAKGLMFRRNCFKTLVRGAIRVGPNVYDIDDRDTELVIEQLKLSEGMMELVKNLKVKMPIETYNHLRREGF